MPKLLPDQSFYPSPTMAMQAAPETLALRRAAESRSEAPRTRWRCWMSIPARRRYGASIARVDMPAPATSCITSAGTPAARACARTRRTRTWSGGISSCPGMRSSRIHILDTKPDPRSPRLVKVIEAEEVIARRPATAGRTPRTADPTASTSTRSAIADGDGPGGIFVLDPETFEIKGRWELDRGPQYLAYDFWWHLGHDTMITSEWGTPNMVEDGVNPELLLGGKYGHALHVWDLRKRRHVQTLDLGPSSRWCSSCDPRTIRPRPTASSASSPR